MLVLDASLAFELMLNSEKGLQALDLVLRSGEELHAPHLIDVEFTQALRRFVAARQLDAGAARQALDDFGDLALERHAHTLLLPRIWELRDAMSAYDAAYVALAELLDVPLVTCDARLSRAHAHRAEIRLID